MNNLLQKTGKKNIKNLIYFNLLLKYKISHLKLNIQLEI